MFSVISSAKAKEKIRGNVRVNIVAQLIRVAIQIASTIILARLLIPEDFGLVAMVSVVANFLGVFKDIGLTHATIYSEDINQVQVSSLFWINTAFSILLTVVFASSSFLVAELFNDNRLILISLVLSLSLLVSGIGLQHRALLLRNLRSLDVVIAEVLSFIFANLIAVWAAANGLGYWSLVLLQVVNASVLTLLLWDKSRWLPSFSFDLASIRGMLKYGANLTASNMLGFFARNTDTILIGRVLGPDSLGLYTRAYSLVSFPLNNLNGPISNAMFPILSRQFKKPEEFKKSFLAVVMWVNFFTTPLLVALTIWGEGLITLLLGDKWQSAGTLFSILAFAFLFQPLGNLSGLLLTSMGQTGRMFRWSLFSSAWIVTSFIVGIQFGLIGIAVAYAIAIKIQQPVLLWYSLRKSPIDVSEYLLKMVPGIALALVILFLQAI